MDADRRQNAVGLIPANETPKPEGRTTPATRYTPAAKRNATPRARRCKGCKQLFTPTKNRNAKCCSDRCRNRVWRQQHTQPRIESTPVLFPFTCDHCHHTAWGAPKNGQRYCGATCRTLAWKARRTAAIAALADYFGIPAGKAADTVDLAGMTKMTRLLTDIGFQYDSASRTWGIPIDRGVFIRQYHT